WDGWRSSNPGSGPRRVSSKRCATPTWQIVAASNAGARCATRSDRAKELLLSPVPILIALEERCHGVDGEAVTQAACRVLIREQTRDAEGILARDGVRPLHGHDPFAVVLVRVRALALVDVRCLQVEAAERHRPPVDDERRLVGRSRRTGHDADAHVPDLRDVDEDAATGGQLLQGIRIPAAAAGGEETVAATVVPIA